MQRSGSAAVVAILLALPALDAVAASLPTPVPTLFTVRSLEPQPGDIAGGASGLNNWGDVVGSAFAKPALFANGQVVPLPGLTAENMTYGGAAAINDAGIAAGSVYSGSTGIAHAAAFTPGGTIDLGVLPGGADSYALAINHQGEIVGFADNGPDSPTFADNAVRFSGGVAINLGVLQTNGYSYATAINDLGVAVGYASYGDGETHATEYVNGRIIDLGVPTGGFISLAYGINNLGQAVGWADFGGGPGRAALFQNGTLTQLGTLPVSGECYAVAINNLSHIVGYCEDGVGNEHPALWAQGQVVALPFLPGTASATPSAINDEDQIAGTAILPNASPEGLPQTFAVLWTPAASFGLPGRRLP